MTISAYISTLLEEIPGLDVEVNHMDDGSDQYGLFKSPARNVTEYLGNTYEITESYQFFARQSAVSKSERLEADEWLETIAYWVDDFRYTYDFPSIDGGRQITDMALTGAPYPMEESDKETLYQMSLQITYTRERKEV